MMPAALAIRFMSGPGVRLVVRAGGAGRRRHQHGGLARSADAAEFVPHRDRLRVREHRLGRRRTADGARLSDTKQASKIRGTLNTIFTIGTPISLFGLWWAGRFGVAEFTLGILLMPAILIGLPFLTTPRPARPTPYSAGRAFLSAATAIIVIDPAPWPIFEPFAHAIPVNSALPGQRVLENAKARTKLKGRGPIFGLLTGPIGSNFMPTETFHLHELRPRTSRPPRPMVVLSGAGHCARRVGHDLHRVAAYCHRNVRRGFSASCCWPPVLRKLLARFGPASGAACCFICSSASFTRSSDYMIIDAPVDKHCCCSRN